MREIIDYEDIRRMRESPIDDALKHGTIITATAELARAMSSYYPEYKVHDIHRLITKIIPQWEQEVKDIKNYVALRDVIEAYVNDNEVRGEVATYLRRNAANMWNAIRLLIEADIYPDDVDAKESEPISRFKDIWKKLEIENKQIVQFKAIFAYQLSQERVVAAKIKEIIGNSDTGIFLFGFYFITPLQDRIFDILEGTGVRLHFLNWHTPRYGNATAIWEKTFPQYGAGNAKRIQEDMGLGNLFGEILEGNAEEVPIKITKDQTELDFAQMVYQAISKGERVYSPDAKQCEKVLKEYYPEYYGQKHLLSYPVGQYIYYLHMLWDSFSDEMNVRYEYVYKCFASGWLTNGTHNGKDCLYEMKVLEPFFKFCRSIREWQERLRIMKEARRALSGFGARPKGKGRWHELLGNPFNNLGIYTITEEQVEIIAGLIEKLFEDAKYLFGSEHRVDLFEHFQKIRRIIHQHMDEEVLMQVEQEIVNDLLARLNDDSTKGIKCPMNGVRDAIIILIGDHFSDYETQEEETSDKQRMVLPLSMVEAALLDRERKMFHLVLANEFTLPGQPKHLPWPLTDGMLDSLKITGSERAKTRKYVKDMRAVIDNRPLSYRYLYYAFIGLLNNDNKPGLSVEWVCRKNDKEIDMSSYARLSGTSHEATGKGKNKRDTIRESLDLAPREGYRKRVPAIPGRDVPEEVCMDYLMCKERYIYAYLLNRLPRFVSEFHYPFEFSKLTTAFSILSGLPKETVSEKVAELFPFLRHIEIRQSTDYASSKGTPEPYEFEGIEYPGQRLLTHFLANEVRDEARRRYEAFLEEGAVPDEPTDTACTYCPYSDICLERHREESGEYDG